MCCTLKQVWMKTLMGRVTTQSGFQRCGWTLTFLLVAFRCLSLDASLCSHGINLTHLHVRALCEAAERLKHDAVYPNMLRWACDSSNRLSPPLSRTLNEKVLTQFWGAFVKRGCNRCISISNALLIIKHCRQQCSHCWFASPSFIYWIWQMHQLCHLHPRSCAAVM